MEPQASLILVGRLLEAVCVLAQVPVQRDNQDDSGASIRMRAAGLVT